jgi:hypothetical protein
MSEEHREWVEGVAAVRGARHPKVARAFVESFPEPDEATLRHDEQPGSDALLADLLGAVLIDAGDELRAAWTALDKAGHPERAERWMTVPPPWPPSSVDTLLRRESNAMALVDTLASQIAPDPAVRSWLVRSWLAPERPVDGKLLAELATAADGRLILEPRFRAWLRSEWSAWARQRFRRVARLAAEGESGGGGGSS